MAKKSKPEKDASAAKNDVDLAEIERLLDFMQKHGLQEFEYEREGVRIVLKKTAEQQTEVRRTGTSPEVGVSSGSAAAMDAIAAGSQAAAAAQTGDNSPADPQHIIKSPIVGTFYWAP